ncbi:MAG: beta-ketoacyl synthase N-terminal-like domain-containing protein [Myxococcota bacterium]|nr:beta-ketoacyl synthase N-terminal-like domain-containing protein [Myxococcota bacterium]
MPDVAVTGVGLCTPLGEFPHHGDRTALEHRDDLVGLPHTTAASVASIQLRPWLKRRKDRKLMARPSQLALAAAGPALREWRGPRDALGLYVGVGREPGDDGESAAALIAAHRDGRVDEAAVAGPCRDVYPPLLPLKTLPNMALAHISIHLDVRGENGAWCGGAAAGMTALRAAIWSIHEGRCDAALVVASDTWVSAGAVRDLLRASGGAPIESPGEAGVALLVESLASASARKAAVFARIGTARGGAPVNDPTRHRDRVGHCHAADAMMAVAFCIGRRAPSAWVEAQEGSQPAVGVSVAVDDGHACYDSGSRGDDRGGF